MTNFKSYMAYDLCACFLNIIVQFCFNLTASTSCGNEPLYKCSRWLCQKYEPYLHEEHCVINPCGGCNVEYYDNNGRQISSSDINLIITSRQYYITNNHNK